MDGGTASKLAGLLYGNILYRDSDDEGFDYHYMRLKDEKSSLIEFIVKFFTCEEFVEKFVVNQTPNELAANLAQSFLGAAGSNPSDHAMLRQVYVHEGLDAAIRKLVQDRRFYEFHGANGVPRYIERAAQTNRR